MIVHNIIQENYLIYINQHFKNMPRNKLIQKLKKSTLKIRKTVQKSKRPLQINNKKSLYENISTIKFLKYVRKSIGTLAPNLTKRRNEQALY